jgi:hypothetical protein
MLRAVVCFLILLLTFSVSAHVNSKGSWPRVHHIRRLLTEQYTVTSSIAKFTSELGIKIDVRVNDVMLSSSHAMMACGACCTTALMPV